MKCIHASCSPKSLGDCDIYINTLQTLAVSFYLLFAETAGRISLCRGLPNKRSQGKVPKKIHKAEREKLKRDQLNDLFLEVARALGRFSIFKCLLFISHNLSLENDYFGRLLYFQLKILKQEFECRQQAHAICCNFVFFSMLFLHQRFPISERTLTSLEHTENSEWIIFNCSLRSWLAHSLSWCHMHYCIFNVFPNFGTYLFWDINLA